MCPLIVVEAEGLIYRNPLPQLRSRKAYFPHLSSLAGGGFLASFSLGEAMESVDQTTVLYRSDPQGLMWREDGFLIEPSLRGRFSDTAKVTALPDGSQIALGYRFDRSDPTLPVGNPQTGGLLDNEVFCCQREQGETAWTPPQPIPTSFKGPVEASAPLTWLSSGALAAPIANFLDWQGEQREDLCGRLLVSKDGHTWTDNVVTMRFAGGRTAIWEQRLCEYRTDHLAVIAWVENLETGNALCNQVALSLDGGQSFAPPLDTGIPGQASGITALGNGKVLTLHAMRRHTEQPGILAVVADLSAGRWDMLAHSQIWDAPRLPPNSALPGVFSAVRFGQPSALLLQDGRLLVSFWCEENGESNIRWIRLQLKE